MEGQTVIRHRDHAYHHRRDGAHFGAGRGVLSKKAPRGAFDQGRAIFRSLERQCRRSYAQKSRHVMPFKWIDPFFPPPTRAPRASGGFFRWALKGSGARFVWRGCSHLRWGSGHGALVLCWVVAQHLTAEAGRVFLRTIRGLAVGGDGVSFCCCVRRCWVSSYMHRRPRGTYNAVQPRAITVAIATRWTKRSRFFDNDFFAKAGFPKEMQTSRALSDVVDGASHTVLFAAASFIGAVLLLGTVDWVIAAWFGVCGWWGMSF